MVLGELGRFVSVGLVAATAAAEPGAVGELPSTVVAVTGIDLVNLYTDKPVVEPLTRFFESRTKRQ